MTDMNFVGMVGRLTRDIEVKYTNSGLAIGRFSIAVNRSTKQKDGGYRDEASFFDIRVLGKLAESMKQYLTKGKQVGIEGFLKQDRWQDENGNNRSSVYIGVNNIELLGGRNDGNSQGESLPQDSDGFQEDIPF